MKVSKTKKKETQLTDIGKQLMENLNPLDLAMQKIKDLSLIVAGLPPFKDNKDIKAYQHLMLKTVKTRHEEHTKQNTSAFKKMLETFRDRIADDDLTWLQENEVRIEKKNSKAFLPLSEAYEFCMKSNEAKLNDMEATLFFIFLHLEDENNESYAKIKSICNEYKLESNKGGDAVANIVKKVRQNVPNGSAQPQAQDVMKVVQQIIGGGDGGDMQSLAESIMSGKLSIPQLVNQVKGAVESDGNNGNEEEESDDEEE